MPSSFADFVNNWDRLLTSVDSRAPELPPGYEGYRDSLQGLVGELRTLGARQDSIKANLHENTKLIEGLMVKGRDLAFHLRTFLKGHYGPRNERLVEFGIRPFRGSGKAKPAAEPPPTSPTE